MQTVYYDRHSHLAETPQYIRFHLARHSHHPAALELSGYNTMHVATEPIASSMVLNKQHRRHRHASFETSMLSSVSNASVHTTASITPHQTPCWLSPPRLSKQFLAPLTSVPLSTTSPFYSSHYTSVLFAYVRHNHLWILTLSAHFLAKWIPYILLPYIFSALISIAIKIVVT